jgi:hypothetical protein
MIEYVEQFKDPTEHQADIYVFTVDDRIVYGYDKYNGYVNFYGSLQSLILREITGEPDINDFKSISKDDFDKEFVFGKWLEDNF